jgi:3-deoxy-7-phosphoheptulonate synthase
VVITMKRWASQEQVRNVVAFVQGMGLQAHLSCTEGRTVIVLVGNTHQLQGMKVSNMPGVDGVVTVPHPFKLASRQFHPQPTTVTIGDVVVGAGEPIVIAGPCAVENWDQILESAHLVKAAGAQMLRGGVFKPRSSPYSFQGLGEEGLKLLDEARRQTGLKIVSEVMDPVNLPMICE